MLSQDFGKLQQPDTHQANEIAGLLEGAHTGTGLGHEFLRHTQRCRLLVHVVDGSSPDPVGDYKAIMTELELFNPELLDKPQVSYAPEHIRLSG